MWHWAGEVQLVGKSNISFQAAKKSPALSPPHPHLPTAGGLRLCQKRETGKTKQDRQRGGLLKPPSCVL